MKKFLLVTSCLLSFGATAQTCISNMDETTPSSIFTDNENGTVTDSRTGLLWMKCSLGQSFDSENNTCTGEAGQISWQTALQTAHGYTFNSINGWRLPNIKELASITERNCVRPAINASFFPATPPDDFWTSTPSFNTLDSVWSVAFFNSSNSLKPKDAELYVRLVKFAP